MTVLELASLHVTEGQQDAFEQAFALAHPYLRAASGHLDSQLTHSTSEPTAYVLLVRWRSIEDHVSGFVGSAGFRSFDELIGPFLGAAPDVQHFASVEA